MKALEFDGQLKLVNDRPRPVPREGEALVAVLLAGICNTDIEITKGYMQFRGIPGHEFVGRVERINGENRDLTGARVVGEINCGCGRCPFCRQGMERHCPERTVLGICGRDGCFAEFLTLPVANLHEVPETVSAETAIFCEPLAAAFEILEQVPVQPDEKVLILGDGKLGQLAARVLSSLPVDVLMAGKHANKLKAATASGVQTAFVADMPERGFDIVVEATGSPQGFASALEFIKPRGRLVLKSTFAAHTPQNLNPVVIDEISIIGSRCGPFEPALRFLQETQDLSPLISGIYPFEKAVEAFEAAERPESLKILLDMRAP